MVNSNEYPPEELESICLYCGEECNNNYCNNECKRAYESEN